MSLNCPELVCCLLRRSILQTSYSFTAHCTMFLRQKPQGHLPSSLNFLTYPNLLFPIKCPQAVGPRHVGASLWREAVRTRRSSMAPNKKCERDMGHVKNIALHPYNNLCALCEKPWCTSWLIVFFGA